VQTSPYPQEQMHRITYAKLTNTATGPSSASNLSDDFADKALKIVTEENI
jgi:hypothetical protein